MSIKILLADDHRLMREGLCSLLEREADIEVISEVGDGRSAVQQAQELLPDVVIMDISMPDLNGIEAARQITAQAPRVKVIALSMHQSEQMVMEMFRAGAAGYVLKLSAFDELVRAVRAVVKNEQYISPGVADVVVGHVLRQNTSPESSVFSILTPREREVLQLLAEGKNSKEIASTLDISSRTVDLHRKNIMDKLHLGSVAELTRYAVREGLVSLED